jgi:eukaryotic-like serine/threonine-protein kinase
MASPARPRVALRFGEFELNAEAGELRKAGLLLKIHPQPFRVLLLLAERSSQIVTREEIQRTLWGDNTFVDFEGGINFCIKQVRSALADDAEKPRYVETVPRRGYRFIASVTLIESTKHPIPFVRPAGSNTALQAAGDAAEFGPTHRIQVLPAPFFPALAGRRSRKMVGAAIIAVSFIGILIATAIAYLRRPPKLTEKDSIVLADFTNTTGDSVFDGTLRQGLSVQLEQSPFLSIISDQQIQQTLRLMDRPPDAKLTPEIAWEICQRTGSAAVLDGSIASLGSQYVLGLEAVNCRTGDSLAREQVQAARKEEVLRSLGDASTKLRGKLGESLGTVQKFNTPVEQATTPSLEALQAFSVGWNTIGNGDYEAAVPFFRRALGLDPKFAMAYASLGMAYLNVGQTALAAENSRKAYELRQKVSEREKFYIESHYYLVATGDLEQARQVCELWLQTYSRDDTPPGNLVYIYSVFGQYEKALPEARDALRLGPGGIYYPHLVSVYLFLDRLEEARAMADEALERKFDSPYLRSTRYQLAFLQSDAAAMEQQVAWAAGRPGVEDALLGLEADTAAYSGRLMKAREFSRQATASAQRAEEKESAADYEADAAVREALFGNATEAKQRVALALRLSTGRDVQYGAALALALTGDEARAVALAEDLGKRFPEDTIVQFNYLPTLHAQLAVDRNNSSKAIEALQVAAPYELGHVAYGGLYPVFVRGEAYLCALQGSAAVAEFQKILDHPGIVMNEAVGAMARLDLARAYVLQGDKAKARGAYQNFLILWNDADPNIPVLRQAKSEYAKLQ